MGVCDEWGGAESRGNGARPVEWMIMNDTCATHRSRVPRRSFGRNKRRSDDIGRRERTRPGFYFMFCVWQSSVRGCRVSFVFVYFIKMCLNVRRFPPPSSRTYQLHYTLVFAEGVRTGEPQGVLNKCYWVTSTLLLLNWTVGKWISSTNRAFHSSLMEGSNWRDWVTNNFIFNWIQQPSQVVNEPSESQEIWALHLYVSLFKLIWVFFLNVLFSNLIKYNCFIFLFYKIETRNGNWFLTIQIGCQIRVKFHSFLESSFHSKRWAHGVIDTGIIFYILFWKTERI